MSITPLMRSFLIPQSIPKFVCSEVSHLRSGFWTCEAERPVVGALPPNGYLAPLSVRRRSCVAYGCTAWLPWRPQPARSARVESGRLFMKSSLFMRHEAETAGNVDHLCPSASFDEPSRRITPVR